MTLPEERRRELLTLTRGAAAALIEDLAHMREVISRDEPPRDELRRLSVTLRRLLVDGGGDLRNVAAPRLRRIKLLVPNNKPFMKFPTGLRFFASGGAPIFGMTIRGISIYDRPLTDAEGRQLPDAEDVYRTVEVRVDGFLAQSVLCFDNVWASRRDAIKYMAIFASGAHSKTPQEPAELALAKIRNSVEYSRQKGVNMLSTPMENPNPPFHYNPNALDLVLVEMLVAAKYLVDSPDTVRLEEIIRAELGIS